MLHFNNGDVFAAGVTEFQFEPLSPDDPNKRIILRVEVENISSLVVIDTGAPYLIAGVDLADRLGVDNDNSLADIKIIIRGIRFEGSLTRLSIKFPASDGEAQVFEATAFIPNRDEDSKWPDRPTFLGFENCLERVRFAIDTSQTQFYFGAME